MTSRAAVDGNDDARRSCYRKNPRLASHFGMGGILPSPVPVVSQTRTYWPLEKDMPVSPAVIPTGQFSAHLALFWATKMVGQPARDARILCADV
jgi:hypothetical protein